ncbi:MAG: pilus assembly protein PilM, partial [Nitrososphaera sp.]|nr:pilus assembly protein PilM [Nitrososphaera sp.]
MPAKPLRSSFEPVKLLLKQLITVKPKEAKIAVGLDIGSSAIKVVVLGGRKADGTRPVIGSHIVPLEAGQEADASGAIKAVMAKLQSPARTVNLSVSGQWVIMRIVEMPVMKSPELRQALPF